MKALQYMVILGCMAASAGSAIAQDSAAPAEATNNSLPAPGEILDLVDKAISPDGGEGEANDWSAPVKLAVVFTILAMLPSLLVMVTSFTRIVIVLGFLRRALTTQSIPPNIAIIGLALFLTLFTMAPTFGAINEQAIEPYMNDELDFSASCSKGNELLKGFMLRQVRLVDLQLFVEMAGLPAVDSPADIPSHVVIPAFAISEFRKAFEMGALIFIPFLLVDLVTSGILLSAGMMMLPPAMISLPFKIILFVLVDGWQLVARTLVLSFH